MDELKDWLRLSLPTGITGIVALVVVAALLGWLVFSEVEMGSVVALLLIGIPIYRFIRNRRARMIKQFVKKVSRIPEVRVITLRENLISVYVHSPNASLYIRLNSLMDTINRKLFYGEPMELVVRDDASDEELNSILREPGVRFVQEGVIGEKPALPDAKPVDG